MTSEMTREFNHTGIRDHRFNCKRKSTNIYNKQDRLEGIENKQALESVTSRLLTAMLELFTTKTFTTPPVPVGSTLISDPHNHQRNTTLAVGPAITSPKVVARPIMSGPQVDPHNLIGG